MFSKHHSSFVAYLTNLGYNKWQTSTKNILDTIFKNNTYLDEFTAKLSETQCFVYRSRRKEIRPKETQDFKPHTLQRQRPTRING